MWVLPGQGEMEMTEIVGRRASYSLTNERKVRRSQGQAPHELTCVRMTHALTRPAVAYRFSWVHLGDQPKRRTTVAFNLVTTFSRAINLSSLCLLVNRRSVLRSLCRGAGVQGWAIHEIRVVFEWNVSRIALVLKL